MNHSFNPFSFDGRLGRAQYLGHAFLMTSIAYFVFFVGLFAVRWSNDSDVSDLTLASVVFIALAVLGLLTCSYTVRRLHDLGHSGKWAIPFYAPWGLVFPEALAWAIAIFSIFILALLFAPGTDGPNEYGAGRRAP